MPEIRALDLSPQGLERTARLLRVVFPTARHITPAYLSRLYHGNPLGPTTGLCAYEGDELVGHYLMIPIRARIFGVEETGIWPFQLATHPGYRLKGLFSRFVEESFDLCREGGFTFFAGVGNANSTPIFVEKWGYQRIRQLDVKLGLGPAPPKGDDSGLELVRIWDRETIAWRLGHPAHPYRVRRSGGVVRVYAQGPYRIPVEVGVFPSNQIPDGLPALRGPAPLRLFVGADPTRDWSRSAYRDVPQRFWPSPLHLLFYDLTGQGRRFDPGAVRYEVFDYDAY
jgi:GNAT superfamily N-acetyltransferase